MIRPLFCGIESCNPIEIRGNHGFMKSIQKDLPRDLDSHSSKLLRQKISLKHIVNKQSKHPTSNHIKSEVKCCQEIQKQKKQAFEQVNKLDYANQQRTRPNNDISQFGQLGQNGRNLLCLKINLHQHQIIRRKNFLPQNEQLQKLQNASQTLTNDTCAKNFSETSKKRSDCIENGAENILVHLKIDQFQPQQPQTKSLKPSQQHKIIQKENLLSDCQNDSTFKDIRKITVKETIGLQSHGSFQYNMLHSAKSQSIINQKQAISPVKMIKFSNYQNTQELMSDYNSARPLLPKSTQNFAIKNLKENVLSPRIDGISGNQYRIKPQIQNQIYQVPLLNPIYQSKEIKMNPVSPFNEISTAEMIKNGKKSGIDSSKHSNGEVMTRQNSKISVFPAENMKSSTLTTMSFESHYSEYQNQKDFQNRFNASRFLNPKNFGVYSYLEKSNSNFFKSNSQQQIQHHEALSHLQDDIIDEGIAFAYEKIAKEKRAKKDLNKALKKKTSIEPRQIDFKNFQKQITNKIEKLTVCQIEGEHSVEKQLIRNKQKKKSGHKKNRSSFFQIIEKQRNRRTERKANLSNFSKTVRSDATEGEELKQLSMLNMKNAESFIFSDGVSSEQDSELEFVVHSSNNVKIKSFALLKSMYGEKHENQQK